MRELRMVSGGRSNLSDEGISGYGLAGLAGHGA